MTIARRIALKGPCRRENTERKEREEGEASHQSAIQAWRRDEERERKGGSHRER